MGEDMAVFKGYLRSLMRQLKLLKKTLDDNNIEEAKKLIDELIEDTQNTVTRAKSPEKPGLLLFYFCPKSFSKNNIIYIGFNFKVPIFPTSFCDKRNRSPTCLEYFVSKLSIDL